MTGMGLPRAFILAAVLLKLSTAIGNELAPRATGIQRDLVFTDYSPLARSAEVAHRLLTPLAAVEFDRTAANSIGGLREQAIDLTEERFAAYIPAHAPPEGYSLLVFVAPWQEAAVPAAWLPILDRYGVIFVSAANSGNEENIVARRIPLALLAAHSLLSRYPIDRDRVFIGGLSGGSRVAMRIALAYPELFKGALLNAGSDPIGNALMALPSALLFKQFQATTRLVFVTGDEDSWNIDHDSISRQSLHQWCVSGDSLETMQRKGHELASAAHFDRALTALGKARHPDMAKLDACEAAIAKRLAADLQQVKSLIAVGKAQDAYKALLKIDARYGGLALPDSVELAAQIGDHG